MTQKHLKIMQTIILKTGYLGSIYIFPQCSEVIQHFFLKNHQKLIAKITSGYVEEHSIKGLQSAYFS